MHIRVLRNLESIVPYSPKEFGEDSYSPFPHEREMSPGICRLFDEGSIEELYKDAPLICLPPYQVTSKDKVSEQDPMNKAVVQGKIHLVPADNANSVEPVQAPRRPSSLPLACVLEKASEPETSAFLLPQKYINILRQWAKTHAAISNRDIQDEIKKLSGISLSQYAIRLNRLNWGFADAVIEKKKLTAEDITVLKAVAQKNPLTRTKDLMKLIWNKFSMKVTAGFVSTYKGDWGFEKRGYKRRC